MDPSALFGRDRESEDGALDFRARGFDGLASLLRESAGKLFFALDHERDDLTQDALALEGGQAARSTKGFYGGSYGGFRVLFAPLRTEGTKPAMGFASGQP